MMRIQLQLGITALMKATSKGNIESVICICEHGADVNIQDNVSDSHLK